MADYYFFLGIENTRKIEGWFEKNSKNFVALKHVTPVTFDIYDTTYSIRYIRESDFIYCERITDKNTDSEYFHKNIILKVEKFLNKLKDST